MEAFRHLRFAFVTLLLGSLLSAQRTAPPAPTAVPRLVNFSGHLATSSGKPAARIEGLTLSIYKEQEGGSALWMETQSVTVDSRGNFTVQLGAAKSTGLPLDLFSASEARWLGVQRSGQEEQPRVLLLSVPYALKAADAETLGGLPVSAFLLAAPAASASTSTTSLTPPGSSTDVLPSATVTGSGTTDFLPLWTGASTVGNSILFQSGTGSTTRIGINTTTPSATLDVRGSATIRGLLTLSATGQATATTGKNSQSLNLTASSFNSNSGTAVNQTFRWLAEPSGNNTNTTSGTLNLLFGSGTTSPTETGFGIANDGRITFAAGQAFPHTISGVTAGTGLTGGGTTGNVTLNIDSSKVVTGVTAGTDLTGGGTGGVLTLNLNTSATDTRYARLSAANSFAGAQTINNTLTLNAGAGPILNAIASSAGVHTPMAQFGSAGSGDANSLRVYNGGSSSGPFTEMFVAADNTFIPGTAVGDGGIRVPPGKNIWFGDATAPRLELNYVGTLVETGEIFAFPNLAGPAINGYGQSQAGGGSDGGRFVGGSGDAASNGAGGSGVSVQAGDGDYGGEGGEFSGGDGTIQAGDGIVVSVGSGPNGYAGIFNGNVLVEGTVTGGMAGVKIDHPLDPANKYLSQASIQSSEMLSLYTGSATLDVKGEADVQMPEWFEAMHGDFRYQLTAVGAPGPGLYIAQEISGGRFRIAGGKPGAKVSWQVSAVRRDAYAQAHPLLVEQPKTKREQGHYLQPELYGAGATESISGTRLPSRRQRIPVREDARAVYQKARKP